MKKDSLAKSQHTAAFHIKPSTIKGVK